MESVRTFTAVYGKTAFEAYFGYIEENPQIDSVGYSLNQVKSELQSKLDSLKKDMEVHYQIKEVYRNI